MYSFLVLGKTYIIHQGLTPAVLWDDVMVLESFSKQRCDRKVNLKE